MPRVVVIDELFVTLRVPRNLPETEIDAVRQTLASATFLKRLQTVILATLREFPALGPVSVTVSR